MTKINGFFRSHWTCMVFIFLTCVPCSKGRNTHRIRLTEYGRVQGKVYSVIDDKYVEKYFGIPFAQPPVGRLRFMNPMRPFYRADILDATVLPPACLQPIDGVKYIESHVPGFNKTSENCLYLNVYVPVGTEEKPYPVLVFVHGGSYQNGMGAMFDGSVLATYGIVVVTFNYRLGPLGFLSAADSELPGNYGLFDQIEALKWVQENIQSFDGDPNRVTIDGHSAGGCSVGILALSPLANGLFSRVIQQSGSTFAQWAVSRHHSRPSFFYRDFTTSVGCFSNTTTEIKHCLQEVPAIRIEQFIRNSMELGPSPVPQYRPVVDGNLLPEPPEDLVNKGHINAESFLAGATLDEGDLVANQIVNEFGFGKRATRKLLTVLNCIRGDLPEVVGIIDYILEQYLELPFVDDGTKIRKRFAEIVGDYFITAPTHRIAEDFSRQNVSVYVYNFEYKSKHDQWEGVVHGAEIMYLSGFPLTGHSHYKYERKDKSMAKSLLIAWSNFIKHGLPSLTPLEIFHFHPYTSERRFYTKITKRNGHPSFQMSRDLKSRKLEFWNRVVPEMFRKQSERHGARHVKTSYITYTKTPKAWALIAACIGLSVLTGLLTIGYCKTRQQIKLLIERNNVYGDNVS